MSSLKKFYSEDGTTIRVTLADGRVALIGGTPRPLATAFHRAALQAGAIPGDVAPSHLPPKEDGDTPPDDLDAKIRGAMLDAVNFDAEDATDDDKLAFADAFTGNGIPNVRWLEKRIGFGISAADRDRVWALVEAELDEGAGE